MYGLVLGDLDSGKGRASLYPGLFLIGNLMHRLRILQLIFTLRYYWFYRRCYIVVLTGNLAKGLDAVKMAW